MRHQERKRSTKNLSEEDLREYGKRLDERPESLGGQSSLVHLAENLLFVRTRSGHLRPLKANLVQLAFERTRGQRNIVLKARQLGLTSWAAARFFIKTITQPGTLTLQVAHTLDSAEEIFRIVHRFLDNMPEHLRHGPLKTSRINVRQIAFPKFDSEYRVVSAGERNAGRGLTVQNLHCSELARWPGDPADILAGLRAALAPDGEQILESTPNGVGGCFYDEWHKAPETGIVRHFYPWWMEECYRSEAVDRDSLSEEERELVTRHALSLEQIGYRRHLKANFRGLACQEFAEDEESCFRASGECVFELEHLEERLVSAQPPVEIRRNGELEVWFSPVADRQYLVAVDPAGGGSDGDYSAAQVLDLKTGMQCAEFAGHVGGFELAQFLVELAREYNDACLVVERNNHGYGVLCLLQDALHYPHLYAEGDRLGFATDSVSRPLAIGRLNAALIDQAEIVSSRRLLTECRTFVRLPNGRTGAQSGTHDDLVMAMAIGLAAREKMLEGGSRVNRPRAR